MSFEFLLKGVAVGFLMAAPIGPIGILCIRGVLLFGRRRGFIIGSSGACGDIIYATAAALGVHYIVDFVSSHQPVMRLAGGVMLIGAGLYTFLSHPKTGPDTIGRIGEKGIFASTFLLALTNPLTLFGYAAAFTAIGVDTIIADHASIILLVAGVFCGSLLWFSFLVWFSQRFKDIVTTRGIVVINKVVGSLLMIFGSIGIIYGMRGLWFS